MFCISAHKAIYDDAYYYIFATSHVTYVRELEWCLHQGRSEMTILPRLKLISLSWYGYRTVVKFRRKEFKSCVLQNLVRAKNPNRRTIREHGTLQS